MAATTTPTLKLLPFVTIVSLGLLGVECHKLKGSHKLCVLGSQKRGRTCQKVRKLRDSAGREAMSPLPDSNNLLLPQTAKAAVAMGARDHHAGGTHTQGP